MNWIDAVLLGVVGASTVLGCFSGLLRPVFGMVSLVASFLVAKQFAPGFMPAMLGWLGPSPLTVAASYAMVFVGALVILTIVSALLRAMFARMDFGGFDFAGGALFGFLRGSLFALGIVLMLSFLPLQKTEAWKESRTLGVAGFVLYLAFRSDALLSYRKYWVLDTKKTKVPLFNTLAFVEGLGNNEKTTIAAGDRKKTLEEINDEFAKVNSQGAVSANEMALRAREEKKAREKKEKEKEGGFLQLAGEMFGACRELNENCLEELENIIAKRTGRKKGTI